MQFILEEYLILHLVVSVEVPSPQFLCTASKYFIGNESQIVSPLSETRPSLWDLA